MSKNKLNKATICRTYDTVLGADVDSGFWENGGWKWSQFSQPVIDDLEANPDSYWKPVVYGDVSDGIQDAIDKGCTEYNGDGWFYSVDPDIDYRTGEHTTYAIHFNNFRKTTLRRIERMILGR